jgi:uridylate kinase
LSNTRNILRDSMVVKLGGNAFVPRGQVSPGPSSLEGIITLLQGVANRGNKVVLVPGGIGGHFHIEWARSAGCSDALINTIGCQLIDLGSTILADCLSRQLLSNAVSPIPARTWGELRHSLGIYDVVVCGHIAPGAITSDSLALMIAEGLGWPLLLIKHALPYAEESVDRPSNGIRSVSATAILNRLDSAALVGKPGWHGPIDGWALAKIQRGSGDVWITTSEALKQLNTNDEALTPIMQLIS